MNQEISQDWRMDITPKTETLKIKEGEQAIITFLDNGKKRESEDYGNSIAFRVQVIGEELVKTFFVKANNFTFLSQIKELGNLEGLKVKISRKGSKKSDTRYTIEKA